MPGADLPSRATKHPYWRVSPKVWDEAWSEDARYLWLYLLTNHHRIAEGLYRLPKGYILADLKWSPERLAEAFSELLRDGCVCYDEAAGVVLIVGALDYQAPPNENCVTFAVRKLAEVPETPLFTEFAASAKAKCKPLYERLRQLFPERFPERLGKPLAKPLDEPLLEPPALTSNSISKKESSQEDQALRRAGAREATGSATDNGGAPPAADLIEKTDPFQVVSTRCLQVAGPATAADIADLVDVEVMRISAAAARAKDPAAYQAHCLKTYEPPEALIAALRVRKERVRRAAFGPRDAPDHEGTPTKLQVGRAMPSPKPPY